MRNLLMTFALMGLLMSCNSQNKVTVNGETVELEDGIYAKIQTNMGDILFRFETEKAPMTSANFIALAEGNHPMAKEELLKEGGYFDGLTFHRVIPDFMIQGGDPEGTGSGGPGYQFPNETDNDLTHKKGTVSMANAGPGTNGSQFFITVAPTPHLDGGYSIFGQVVEGQNVADSISMVPTAAQNKPKDPVVMEDVSIIRKGKEAKDFNAAEVFQEQMDVAEEAKRAAEEEAKRKAEEANKKAEQLSEGMEITNTGLRYDIVERGEDTAPEQGQTVRVHYKGQLADGTVFDNSYDRGQPIEFPLGQRRVIPGWDEGIGMMTIGDSARFVIPPDLAYGAQGRGPIPPNSWLIFDVELVGIQGQNNQGN